MKIGIDGSRAFIKNRTGIEEYSYQVTKNLRNSLNEEKVFLYVRKNQHIDFELPKNWQVKVIKFPRFWTQLGLSLEMFLHPVDVLFVPAHTVPIIHPAKTIVTIHGLEYEFCPEAYSFWEKLYMRWTIKKSCQWASEIISVSENTKKDLINLYKVPKDKIVVVYEGYFMEHGTWNMEQKNIVNSKCSMLHNTCSMPFLLFIGRIEQRKNVTNIIKAFEILKEKYNVPHKLVLAGKKGFGYEKIQNKIQETRYNNQIVLTGFISEDEKWELLKKADVFVFPTLYEGFGIPILEAQSASCPVVASNNSSIPEVTLDSALLVDPQDPQDIAEAVCKLISDESLKNAIITKGLKNVQRFSWNECANKIAKLLCEQKK